jgi:hypothetical protein
MLLTPFVIPAKAGIHGSAIAVRARRHLGCFLMDPRLRGDDMKKKNGEAA